jgi:glycosyltransferase involved in cell wall biosynthesis
VGHAGRLAPEKNLGFLAEAVVRFLLDYDRAHFLVVGGGPSREELQKVFEAYGLTSRLHLAGILEWRELVRAYRAMDVFAFASQTETQGMVLTEAMAAGIPVVAVDAAGVREVVRDQENGRLLSDEDEDEFAAALGWIASLSPQERQRLEAGVAKTAAAFSMHYTSVRTLALYESLMGTEPRRKEIESSPWASARRRIGEEWKILGNIAHAFGDAVLSLHRVEEEPTTSGKR